MQALLQWLHNTFIRAGDVWSENLLEDITWHGNANDAGNVTFCFGSLPKPHH